MSEEIQVKDSYDEFLQFSRITPENWLFPDRKNYVPSNVTSDKWIHPVLKPRLASNVPRTVVQLFEIARGATIYSWFFYPLATLGLEQCMRIGEVAARERCAQLQQESENFSANLRTLLTAQVISPADEVRWQAMRRLRNDRSHLQDLMLMDAGAAIGVLQLMVELINSLFSTPGINPDATWEANISQYLDDVQSDWKATQSAFPKNFYTGQHWPVPFFGNPAKALVATVGVNPSAGEFQSGRGWDAIKSKAEWAHRLRRYFRDAIPPHDWFETWQIGLEVLRVPYKTGAATHFDVSYRPTTAMLKNDHTDPNEFGNMVERDVQWFFRLLPLCPLLKGLLVFGPVVRNANSRESLAGFIRRSASRHGFTVTPDGSLQNAATKRTFFVHEADTPDEKCVAGRVIKNLYRHRDELGLRMGR